MNTLTITIGLILLSLLIVHYSQGAVSDRDLVAMTLLREAGGERDTFRAMLAVMCVIDNRAKGSPYNYREVILKPKQFSCWNLGIGQSDKNLLRNHPKAAVAYNIADLAFKNRYFKSEIGIKYLGEGIVRATHYFNPTIANPKWAKELTFAGAVGNHVFYY